MGNITYATALNVALTLIDASIAEGTSEFLVYENTKDAIHVHVDDAREKLTALKEQLAKRTASKTPTKTQKENEIIMTNIFNALVDIGEPTTVTNLIAHGVEGFPTADGKVLTSQKASPLLRKLVDAGKVVKTIEGKKALFAVA